MKVLLFGRRPPGRRSLPSLGLDLLVQATSRWLNGAAPQLGASIAFYTVFSITPCLLMAVGVAGTIIGAQAAQGEVFSRLQDVMGPAGAGLIRLMIQSAHQGHHHGWAAALGIVTFVAGATAVFAELRRALNLIGESQSLRSSFRDVLRARLMGVILIVGFGALLVTLLLLDGALAMPARLLGPQLAGHVYFLRPLLDALSSVIAPALVFAALLGWLPDRAPRAGAVTAGAAAATVLFALGKHLIGIYLSRVALTSSLGAASSLIVVMMWAYYTAQILLYGAAIAFTWDDIVARMNGSTPDIQPSSGPSAASARPVAQAAQPRP